MVLWKEYAAFMSVGFLFLVGVRPLDRPPARCFLEQLQLKGADGTYIVMQGTFLKWSGLISREAFFLGLRKAHAYLHRRRLLFRERPALTRIPQVVADMARFGHTNEFCYVPIGPTEMRGEAGLKRAGGVSTYELVLKMPAHWSYGNRLFGGLEGPEARRCIATKDGKAVTIDCAYIRGMWLDSNRVAVSVWAGVSLWDRQTEDPLRPPIVNPVPFPCVKQRRRPFKHLQLRFPRYKGMGDGDHVLVETDRILWLRTRGWDENHAEPCPRPHTRFECIYREKRSKRARVGDNESSSSSNSSSSSSSAAAPPPPPPPPAATAVAAAPAGLPHGEDESDNDSETEARELLPQPLHLRSTFRPFQPLPQSLSFCPG